MEPQQLPGELPEKALLIERYLSGDINGEEAEVLKAWVGESPQHQAFFDSVTNKNQLLQLLQAYYAAEAMTTAARETATELVFGSPAPVRHMRSRVKPWTVAAAVLILITAGAYLWLNKKETVSVAVTNNTPKPAGTDIAPGQYKARLTLADGSQVVLDSAGAGTLAQQGNTQVKNRNGGLVYEPAAGSTKEMLYNTLTTAKGEIYALSLSDGTRLWLNSGSSIRYPVTFSETERAVTITGEVYFEVAKNEHKPFAVIAAGQKVQVLGTHFNINAYADEATIRTTLLEGRVAVTPAGSNKPVVLKPGQQAAVSGAKVDVIEDADTEQAIAWKNGYFQFNGEELKTVMRQLERWYDVEVVFEGNVPNSRFAGTIPRDAKASRLLEMLEKSGIHFRIEGKKIIVTP